MSKRVHSVRQSHSSDKFVLETGLNGYGNIIHLPRQFSRLGPSFTIEQGNARPIPSGVANADELRAKTEGVFSNPLRIDPESMGNFTSAQISTEANRWRGSNRGGYVNPLYDRTYGDYLTALETERRQGLLADLLKMAADEVIFAPVYYDASTAYVAFRKGIRGPGEVSSRQLANLWNVQTWDAT